VSTEPWNHLVRLGDAEDAGEISAALASTSLGARRIATVARTTAGNLKVIVWQVGFDGAVQRLDSAEGGLTTRVVIASLGINRFVTAARTEAGGLKLTAWNVNDAGQITRRGSGETGEIHGEFAIATFSTYLAVTAVRDSADRLKLVSWKIDGAGSIQRLNDIVGDPVGQQVSVAPFDPYPPANGALATAVTTPFGNLQITGWQIDTAGAFKRLGDVQGMRVKDVVAANLSHRRIVTAARTTTDDLLVQTWDYSPRVGMTLHASENAGEVSSIAIATLNAARVFTAVRDSAGNLKVIAWDAIDKVVRLGSAGAGTVGLVSIVSLGADWIVTPVQTAANTVKAIAWREHAVSLLYGEWPVVNPQIRETEETLTLERAVGQDDDKELRVNKPVLQTAPSESLAAERAAEAPPMHSIPFDPAIEGVDPMIAVGFNYIIVTQEGTIAFFNKLGDQLKDKDGNWVNLTTREFFAGFLAGRRPDGSRNEHCINRHTGFPPHGQLADYPPSVNCDPDAADTKGRPLPPGVREFYDTRVHFDPESRRFFIFAPARTTKLLDKKTNSACSKEGGDCINTSKQDNPFNRRYWAVAVSKNEDPREGFHQWMSTEAYIADGPEFSVNRGVMVITKYSENADIQPIGMKPAAYALCVTDLLAGNRYPRSHKLFRPDFPSYGKGELSPVTQYGSSNDRTFLVESHDFEIVVYSFKNPVEWQNFPPVDRTSATIVTPGGTPIRIGHLWQREHPKYRDGKIYFTSAKVVEPREPNVRNPLLAVRVFRLPLKNLSTTPMASVNPADGFLYHLFGTNAPDDSPGDKVSYEQPTVAVNKEGHMVILFCRIGFDTNEVLHPEARYSVYYSDERGPRSSRIIRKGDFTLTWENPDDPEPRQQTIRSPYYLLDYQTAVVDPADDRTVWMISEYGDAATKAYKTVVGKVIP
jgi:hypothetical protein